MNTAAEESTGHLLRQVRTLLALTALMVLASTVIDPPYSTIGMTLNAVSVVVLIFVVWRIQSIISRPNSPISDP